MEIAHRNGKINQGKRKKLFKSYYYYDRANGNKRSKIDGTLWVGTSRVLFKIFDFVRFINIIQCKAFLS